MERVVERVCSCLVLEQDVSGEAGRRVLYLPPTSLQRSRARPTRHWWQAFYFRSN